MHIVSSIVCSALVLALAQLPLASALYSSKSAVIAVTDKNINEVVLDTEHAVILEFFAPWCGHCQRFAPEYEKAASNLKNLVRVAAVDCDVEANKPLCGRYQIQGFPTVKVFPGGKTGSKKVPFDYQGARTAKAVVDFAHEQIPSFVQILTSKETSKKATNFDSFLAEKAGEVAHAVLYTSKTKTPPMFKALSVEFHHRLLLGEVRQAEKELIEKYEIKQFPSLVVFPKEADAQPITYDGSLKFEAIEKFLEPYALPPKNKKKATEKSAKESVKEEEPFDPNVVEITTQEQFETNCLKKPLGLCFIAIVAPINPEDPDSETNRADVLKAFQEAKKTVHESKIASPFHFGWIEVTHASKLVSGFSLSDYMPQFVAFSPTRKFYRTFMGGYDGKALAKFASDVVSGRGPKVVPYKFDPVLD